MKSLQYALIKDNCTYKESLTLDLKPPLQSETNFALNFGPNIGKRVTLSAKLPSSNNTKSACNGMKQMGLNLLKTICIDMIMKNAVMKMITKYERTPKNLQWTCWDCRNVNSVRMTC